jgi:signal transduction histidine kinase
MLLRYALFLALVVAIALGLSLVPTHGSATIPLTSWAWRSTDASSRTPITNPDADEATWTPIAMPASPPAPLEGMLWMRVRLPTEHFVDPAIAIDAVTGPAELWLDGVRIHALPDPDGVESTYPGGVPWMLVRLPQGYEGKTLVLRLRPDYRPLGIRGTPALGERADLLEEVIVRDVPRLVVGMLTILIGLLATVVLARREDRRLLASYAVTMVAYGVYVISYTHLKDRLVDAPRFWFWVWLVEIPVILAAGGNLIDALFGEGDRTLLRRLARAALVVAVAVLVVHPIAWFLYGQPATRAFAIRLFGGALLVLRAAIGLGTLVVLVPIGQRARTGDRDARVFLYGFSVVMVFSLRDVLSSLGVSTFAQKSQMHLGIFALTLAFTLIVQRRYATATERAARFGQELAARTREKERFLRDLHDGVGGLTSNVRMLAELGRQNDARARAALDTIAELSKESLAELRLFVQALDESETSWAGLAAELRRFGAQLVEPTGRAFEMTMTVERTGAPDGFVRLNVLRIYREALTNALKQSQAKTISVELRVLADTLSLTVTNDGASGARDAIGIDTGRGVSHMRARAAELGGELQLVRSDGDRLSVVLRVPNKPPAALAPGELRRSVEDAS